MNTRPLGKLLQVKDMDWNLITHHPAFRGAVSGFASAFLVDLHAWSKAGPTAAFDWALAAKRWVSGAVSGIAIGFGFEANG